MSARAPLRFGLPPVLGARRVRALAARLETVLTAGLDQPVTVRVAGSYEHLEVMLLGGGLDVAWANSLVVARAVAAGSTAMLQSVRGGRRTFRAALLARRSSNLSLSSLSGTRAAWTDPDALGGYLLPLEFLRSRGYAPESLFASERFTGSYPGAIARLLDGSADVAPTYAHSDDAGELLALLEAQLGPVAHELTALAFTEEIPSDGVVVAPYVPAAKAIMLRDRLRELLSAPAAAQVRQLLDVDELVPARPAAYGALRALANS
jgi:phosphonate transport system substrate-binding protein